MIRRCEIQHRVTHIDPDDLTVISDYLCELCDMEPGSATNVNDTVAKSSR